MSKKKKPAANAEAFEKQIERFPQDPGAAMEVMVNVAIAQAERIIANPPANPHKVPQANQFLLAVSEAARCSQSRDLPGVALAMFYVGLHAGELGVSAGRKLMSFEMAASHQRRGNAGKASAKWTPAIAERAHEIFREAIRARYTRTAALRLTAGQLKSEKRGEFSLSLLQKKAKLLGW